MPSSSGHIKLVDVDDAALPIYQRAKPAEKLKPRLLLFAATLVTLFIGFSLLDGTRLTDVDLALQVGLAD
jgi:hypothetical protein